MSVCLSCGRERDTCEICGGDLEDAHVYCANLRAENERLKDAVWELTQMHGAKVAEWKQLKLRNARLEMVAEAAEALVGARVDDDLWDNRRIWMGRLDAALAALEEK